MEDATAIQPNCWQHRKEVKAFVEPFWHSSARLCNRAHLLRWHWTHWETFGCNSHVWEPRCYPFASTGLSFIELYARLMTILFFEIFCLTHVGLDTHFAQQIPSGATTVIGQRHSRWRPRSTGTSGARSWPGWPSSAASIDSSSFSGVGCTSATFGPGPCSCWR